MATLSSYKPSKWLRVLIPSILIVVWLALAGIGGPYFGKINQVVSNDQTTFLPESAESTKVNEQIKKFQTGDTIPGIIIFTNDQKLSPDQVSAITSGTASLTKS